MVLTFLIVVTLFLIHSESSIPSWLQYFSKIKQNIFLDAFEFERRIKDPESQLHAFLEACSAMMKARSHTVV